MARSNPLSFQKIAGMILALLATIGILWTLLGRSEFEDILNRLGDSGSMDKHARARLLEQMDRYITPLSEALQDRKRSVPIRSGIAQVLGESRDPRAIKPLVAALEDPSHFLREAAIHALGELSLPESIPHLERALSDPHPSVKQSSVNSLIRLTERREQQSKTEALQILRTFRKSLDPADPLCPPIDQVLTP